MNLNDIIDKYTSDDPDEGNVPTTKEFTELAALSDQAPEEVEVEIELKLTVPVLITSDGNYYVVDDCAITEEIDKFLANSECLKKEMRKFVKLHEAFEKKASELCTKYGIDEDTLNSMLDSIELGEMPGGSDE